MSEALRTIIEIKKIMGSYGWQNGGGPDCVKLDDAGNEIARHGDAVWIEDMNRAMRQYEREMILAEIERRASA